MQWKYIIPLLFLLSCVKDVEIDGPLAEERIVVQGKIETDGYPEVLLTRSVGFFEGVDFNDLENYVITDALVVVEQNGVLDTLETQFDITSIPPFIFCLVER